MNPGTGTERRVIVFVITRWWRGVSGVRLHMRGGWEKGSNDIVEIPSVSLKKREPCTYSIESVNLETFLEGKALSVDLHISSHSFGNPFSSFGALSLSPEIPTGTKGVVKERLSS